jgi:hypothetical protein
MASIRRNKIILREAIAPNPNTLHLFHYFKERILSIFLATCLIIPFSVASAAPAKKQDLNITNDVKSQIEAINKKYPVGVPFSPEDAAFIKSHALQASSANKPSNGVVTPIADQAKGVVNYSVPNVERCKQSTCHCSTEAKSLTREEFGRTADLNL